MNEASPPPEETTLGGLVRPTGARSITRRGVPSSTHASALGSGFLGLGMAIIASLQSMIGIALFLLRIDLYPSLLPIAAAWLLLMVTFLGLTIAISASGERLPQWLYVIFLSALAAVVGLDLIAIGPLGDVARYATASVSAGFVLLVVVTLRPHREVLAAAAALGIALTVAIVVTTPLNPVTIPAQVVTVALAVGPGVAGVLLIRGFDRMLKRELDRVLVRSTVTAPRLAVGMLASEELTRLDLDAEKLLDAVATGALPLPLPERETAWASTLATELRLHLIEGRRETWLFHAISESEHLGPRVTVGDPAAVAGLLDDVQRDALLAALWLLAADPSGAPSTRTVSVSLEPVDPTAANGQRRLIVPIRVTVPGLRRNRIDPGVWEAFDRVGRYSDSTVGGAVVIDLDCSVENPTDSVRSL